jgi:ABC-type glycerol-3-phosphate transport system substrate-binding protein
MSVLKVSRRPTRNSHWLVCTLLLVFTLVSMPAATATRCTLQVYLAETTAPYVAYVKDDAVPKFEARYPDVKIDLQLGNWGADSIAVRYAGGAAPDVIQLGSGIASYDGMLLPLDSYTRNWRRDLADFPPGAIEAVTMRGELLAIPFVVASRTLTYRKSFFADSGLDPDRPPATWGELVEYGKRLVRLNAEGAMIRQGFETSSHFHDYSPFLFQAGGDYMSEDLTQVVFAENPGMEALEYMSDLFHVAHISSKSGGEFKKGQAAITYASQTYISPMYQSASVPNDDIGVGLPLKHRHQSQLLLPNSWAIINKTTHPQEAWDWIAHASSSESAISAGRATGVAPPRRSILSYAPWNTDPRWRITFEAMSMAMPAPMKSPYFDDMRKMFVTPGLGKVLYEQAPLAIWKDMQRQAQAWLSDLLK